MDGTEIRHQLHLSDAVTQSSRRQFGPFCDPLCLLFKKSIVAILRCLLDRCLSDSFFGLFLCLCGIVTVQRDIKPGEPHTANDPQAEINAQGVVSVSYGPKTHVHSVAPGFSFQNCPGRKMSQAAVRIYC